MRSRVLKAIMTVLVLSAGIRCMAIPARSGITKILQPDGSVIEVMIKGDEFGHIMTTVDGCAVMRGSDGYFCYARFNWDGSRVNTGVRVGADRNGDIESASRRIPYAQLYRQSAERRARVNQARVRREAHVATKADNVHRAIVILAQFPDLSFKNDRSAFVDLVNKEGYDLKGATGSALDYFKSQFKGAADFEFEVGPVVTLAKSYSYYGKDDEKGYDLHPGEAVAEACRLSDKDVDFSKYDYIFMFYAGGNTADGGADDDHLWPHSWDLREAGVRLVLDGKTLGAYAITSELMYNRAARRLEFTSIGTFCHEYSHTLGLVDMYDADYEESGGKSKGLWESTSIMDGGNYNNDGKTPPGYNAIELEMLGLVTPEPIDFGDYTLEPLNTSRRVLKLETGNPGEYFLFEARQALGWDRYIGGSGLLVYHIDKSSTVAGYSSTLERDLTAAERWEANEVNCNPQHECADLIEADAQARNASQVFFPSGNVTSLSPKSHPAFKYWNGGSSVMVLNRISRLNGVVSFTVNGPLVVDSKDVYQDAAILNWHTDLSEYQNEPSILKWITGSTVHEAVVKPYEPGRYSYTIEGLQAGTEYSVRISVGGSGADETASKFAVTTKPFGGQPFIYLQDASRNSAGKFTVMTRIPLRVYNLRNVKHVTWYWNDREVTAGNDGYYELLQDGTLKALVTYNDGSEEIFIKKISIR